MSLFDFKNFMTKTEATTENLAKQIDEIKAHSVAISAENKQLKARLEEMEQAKDKEPMPAKQEDAEAESDNETLLTVLSDLKECVAKLEMMVGEGEETEGTQGEPDTGDVEETAKYHAKKLKMVTKRVVSAMKASVPTSAIPALIGREVAAKVSALGHPTILSTKKENETLKGKELTANAFRESLIARGIYPNS